MCVPVGESIVSKIVCRNCPISLAYRVSYVDVVRIFLILILFNVWIGAMHVLYTLILGQER